MSALPVEGGPALERARARRRRRADKRGVALVMVLGAITVLTVFLTQLQEDTSAELSAALAERDALKAEYFAKSGVNLGRLLIAMEPQVGRSVAIFFGGKAPQIPIWAFSDQILGAFNDPNGAQAFGGLLPNADYSTAKNLGIPGGGHFELRIVDEDSKLDLNSVYTAAGTVTSELHTGAQILGLIGGPQYNPMFEGRDADGQFTDRAAVCGALVDWADPDENLFGCNPQQQGPSVGGAEDNFYQTIGLPYRRKNAAFDSLDELRLVRGMSDDFWATFVDPDPSKPDKRILTVWGTGQINVNTANAMTLLALVCGNAPESELCIDPMQMQSFVSAVTMVRTLFAGFPLFPSTNAFMKAVSLASAAADPKASSSGAADSSPTSGMLGGIFSALGIKPVVFKDPRGVKSMISVRSKMFSFYSEGVVPGYRKETRVGVHAVVDFRGAQPLGSAFGLMAGAMAGAAGAGGLPGAAGLPGGATTTPAPTNNQDASQATPEAMMAAMAANPAGVIVYYRVE